MTMTAVFLFSQFFDGGIVVAASFVDLREAWQPLENSSN